ncbi:unnamed protein product, partial [Mesorhabditis belari]|uniref:Palmitoyltransferase n=1 Tax=Mesorhabditis belari TaxID=2138241 RepID=A0AAF3F6M1_9BILA
MGREKTQCCGRKWCVGDVCGIICAVITWGLVIYGETCILWVMMSSWELHPVHQTVNFIIFNFFAIMALTSHAKTMLTDPGAVPKGNATDDYIERLQLMNENKVVYKCQKCCSIKPERAHHCSVCERCIRRMDHHCPWVNNCVGEGNQKYFVLFTLYIACLSIHALYWGVWQFVECVGSEWATCPALSPPATTLLLIFLLFEGVLFAIFTGVMFGTQISAICSDETAIESLKRGDCEKVRGSSWKNLQMVFGGPFSWRWLSPLVEPYATKATFEYSV